MDVTSGSQLFSEHTPLGFSVRVTEGYWELIAEVKYPAIAECLEGVRAALSRPAQVRQSKSDPSVFLFYSEHSNDLWICAVAKRLNGEGFLITAYVTDSIKEGEQVWPR